MTTPLTDAEKIRGAPWIVTSRVFNDFFQVFCFGQVLMLFLNAMKMDKTQIGFIWSLFAYCGLISLFAAPTVARFGLKRSYLLFFTVRKVFALGLLFVPWVATHYGMRPAFWFVAGCIFFFSVCRALGETAANPWLQEAIPNRIRGKLSGIITTVFSITHFFALLVATYVLKNITGLNGYRGIMAVGLVGGLAAVWCWYFVPGGRPQILENPHHTHVKTVKEALQNRTFLSYMITLTVLAMGGAGMAFMILFQKDRIGLSDAQIISLGIPALAGTLISSFPWGWAADKYGSKPIMVSGLFFMMFFPILWFLIPKFSPWSYTVAAAVTFLGSIVSMGWSIGVDRYLFTRVVPEDKSASYMSVYYSWSGLMGGIAPFLGGMLLDFCKPLKGSFGIFKIDEYTPAFALNVFSFAVALFIIRWLPSDGSISTGQFMRLLVTTNPVKVVRTSLHERRLKKAAAG